MNKRIIGFILSAALLVPLSVQAADITRDISKSDFVISGKVSPGSAVTVTVLAPGKTISDLDTAARPFDVVKFQKEVYADSKGNYSINAEFTGDSNVYTAFIMEDGKVSTKKLEFINKEKNAIAVPKLLGKTTATDIKACIEENRNDLGFFNKLYDGNEDDISIELVGKFKSQDPESIINTFNDAVISRALAEDINKKVSDYADLISVLKPNQVAGKWYKKVDADKVDERVKNVNGTIKGLLDKVNEAVLLEVVENSNGYANIKAAIKDFKLVENPVETDSVYQTLADRKKHYGSCEELKRDYLDIINAPVEEKSYVGGGGGASLGMKMNNNIPAYEVPNVVPIEKSIFSDLTGFDWAKPAITYLAQKGILSGKSENEFAPGELVKREEFVTMLVNAFGFTRYADENPFADVSNDAWYFEYVLAAEQCGIVSGISESDFGTGSNITRQDMAVMLGRVLESKNISISSKRAAITFNDDSDIANYAKDAISSLYEKNIINGMDSVNFKPRENASRAQAAQMIYQILIGREG